MGGLGVFNLTDTIQISLLKFYVKAQQSTDSILRAICTGSLLKKQTESIASDLGLDIDDITMSNVLIVKKGKRKNYFLNWSQNATQGKGAENFKNDYLKNICMRRPDLLKPTRYLTFVRLRANVAHNKTSVLHGTPAYQDLLCRHCHIKLESLGHVLGECTHFKEARIRRHNEVMDFIRKKIENIFTNPKLMIEPEFIVKDSNNVKLKPDLVFALNNQLYIIDVTVRLENGTKLKVAFEEKIEKYKILIPQLIEQFKVKRCKVLPLVFGSRGVIPLRTIRFLKLLNIEDKRDLLTLSLICIRTTLEIYHGFMDYV